MVLSMPAEKLVVPATHIEYECNSIFEMKLDAFSERTTTVK